MKIGAEIRRNPTGARRPGRLALALSAEPGATSARNRRREAALPVATSGHAAAFWAGLHIILLLVLSILVVRKRQLHRVALGDGGIPDLARAIRTFGNATEYVPAGMATLALFAVLDAAPVVVHMLGVMLFVGRVIHAVGLWRSGEATLARAVGVTITWLAYLFAGVALLLYAVA